MNDQHHSNLLCLFYFPVVRSMDIIEPPSGTRITARVDAVNVTRLECDIFSSPPQRELVEWRLETGDTSSNLVNDPRFRLQEKQAMSNIPNYNFITIVRFTMELDGQNLICKSGRRGKVASFPLTVFGELCFRCTQM